MCLWLILSFVRSQWQELLSFENDAKPAYGLKALFWRLSFEWTKWTEFSFFVNYTFKYWPFAGFGSQHIFDASLPPSLNAITSASTLNEMAVAGESFPLACLRCFHAFLCVYMYCIYVSAQSVCSVCALQVIVRSQLMLRWSLWSSSSDMNSGACLAHSLLPSCQHYTWAFLCSLKYQYLKVCMST